MYSNDWRPQRQYLLLQIACVYKEKKMPALSLLDSLCAQMRGLTALKLQALKLMERRNVWPAGCVYFTSALICLTFLNI